MSALKQKTLVVIGGATATGKTATAIRLARHFDTAILSCDSRQFFKEMNIGTAKPNAEELAAVPHHFIGHLSIHDPYSVGDFEREALQLLDQLFLHHNVVLLTGGSGLYIKALCEGLDIFPDISPEVHQKVEVLYKEKGLAALQQELLQLDPDYYQKVDLNNPVRLIRALKVIYAGGQPFSSFQNKEKPKRRFQPVYINLVMDRMLLYDRINRRVDQMMAAGLLEEARQLYPYKNLNALQTVGYQELFDYFDNKIALEEAVSLIKQNSRRYAKRQMTWFRKASHWTSFSPEAFEEILNHILHATTSALD